MNGLMHNFPLWAALASIVLAQAAKVPLHWFSSGRWDPARCVGTGGMPSSHSAGVSSLAAAVGMTEGFSSSVFAVAVLVGVITMYDAAGIRRHAGLHAAFLNRLIRTLTSSQPSQLPEQAGPMLKERLGHRPIEVAAGAVFGIAVSVLLHLCVRP